MQFPHDPCLWKKCLNNGSYVQIEIVVDDIFGVTDKKNEAWVDGFVGYLEKSCAPCKHLGQIKSCLGIELIWGEGNKSVSISSERKIKQLLLRHDLTDLKPRKTPLEPGVKLAELMKGELLSSDQKTIYQSIVGSLLYITRISRVDLLYGTWFLACGMSAPTDGMWKQAIHILRYCKGTAGLCITYSRDPVPFKHQLDLSDFSYVTDLPVAFSDSNYESQYSVSCGIVMYRGAALFWMCRKQQGTVSRSTVEAELRALSSVGQTVMRTRTLFAWFEEPLLSPTTVFCDNRGAIQNARHPCFSDKLRHVENAVFYIRELEENKNVQVEWLNGLLNPPDLGTKAVGTGLHKLFASFLMGCDIFPGDTNSARHVRLLAHRYRTYKKENKKKRKRE